MWGVRKTEWRAVDDCGGSHWSQWGNRDTLCQYEHINGIYLPKWENNAFLSSPGFFMWVRKSCLSSRVTFSCPPLACGCWLYKTQFMSDSLKFWESFVPRAVSYMSVCMVKWWLKLGSSTYLSWWGHVSGPGTSALPPWISWPCWAVLSFLCPRDGGRQVKLVTDLWL